MPNAASGNGAATSRLNPGTDGSSRNNSTGGRNNWFIASEDADCPAAA